ncbi:MAG: endonuclease [Bacilli bacterium]
MKKTILTFSCMLTSLLLSSFIIPDGGTSQSITVLNSEASISKGENKTAIVGNNSAINKLSGELLAVEGHLDVESLTSLSHNFIMQNKNMLAYKFSPIVNGIKVIYTDTSDKILKINPQTINNLSYYGSYETTDCTNWNTLETTIKEQITSAVYTAPLGYSWSGALSYTQFSLSGVKEISSPKLEDYKNSIMVIKPVIIKENANAFEVKVTGVTAKVNGNKTYSAHFDELVTFTSTSNNFKYWKVNEDIVSYQKELKLTVFGSLNAIEITTGSISRKANIYKHDIQTVSSSENGVYQIKYELLSGQSLVETGMLFKGKTYETATSKVVARSISADNEYAITSLETGDNVAYLMYKDIDGSLKIIYSAKTSEPVPQPTLPPYYGDSKEYMALSGASLKTKLFTLVSTNAKTVSYKGLWDAFFKTDVRSDGTIWDMYGEFHFTRSAQGQNYKVPGDGYNREHSVPKSWFNEATPMYSDLWHLYPTDGKINNTRSNYMFGEVDDTTPLNPNLVGSPVGAREGNEYGKIDSKWVKEGISNGTTVFEPREIYKGDFARTYFMMATLYQDRVSSWNAGNHFTPNTFPSLSKYSINLFLTWAKNDPVSEKEINRNEEVYKIQNNRNPFIDYPDFAEMIWGNAR